MTTERENSSNGTDDARRITGKVHLSAVVAAVLGNEALDDPRWKSLSVVFSLTAKGRNFGNSGYAYGEGSDWWAFSCPVLDVRPAVLSYLNSAAEPMPDGLCRVLLQFDRETGRARLIPSFGDYDRWNIEPETARAMVDALRPDFSMPPLEG